MGFGQLLKNVMMEIQLEAMDVQTIVKLRLDGLALLEHLVLQFVMTLI